MPVFSFLSKEAQFVQRIRSGDRRAEREFFDYCYEYCLRSLRGDDFFSKDYFQDALLQIWTEIQDGRVFLHNGAIWRRPKTKGKEAGPMSCSLRSFMVTICRNMNAKQSRGPIVIKSESGREITDDDWDAFEQEEDEERKRIVNACVENLPPHCREILIQFYVQGYNLDEMMKESKAHASKDGLKSSKSKCLDRLRKDVMSTFIAHQLS